MEYHYSWQVVFLSVRSAFEHRSAWPPIFAGSIPVLSLGRRRPRRGGAQNDMKWLST